MGLKDLKLPTSAVALPGGDSFVVRGLSLPDISAIVRQYRTAATALFERYVTQARDGGSKDIGDIADEDVAQLGQSLLDMAPEIAAAIIAHAADAGDDEGLRAAEKLPFPVQMDALVKIWKLTFDAEGGPKKAIETVVKVLRGANDLMGDLRTSKIGFSGFAGR